MPSWEHMWEKQIERKSARSAIQGYVEHISATDFGPAAIQLCNQGSPSTKMFGIFLNAYNDLNSAQTAVRRWNDASCITEDWGLKKSWAYGPTITISSSESLVRPANFENEDNLNKAATCSYTQAEAGDGCWSLADRCKITQDQLKEYNGPDVCKIEVGKYVCCSA